MKWKKRDICVSFLYPQQVFLLKGWSIKSKKFCNPKKNGNTVDENYSAGAFPRLAWMDGCGIPAHYTWVVFGQFGKFTPAIGLIWGGIINLSAVGELFPLWELLVSCLHGTRAISYLYSRSLQYTFENRVCVWYTLLAYTYKSSGAAVCVWVRVYGELVMCSVR
jgi:hypothetical protein